MTTPDVTPEAPAATGAPPKTSVLEDFVDIFYAPSRVFARHVDGGFGIPLLIVVIVGILLYFLTRSLIAPAIDADATRAIAIAIRKNPQITPEMADKMRSMQGNAIAGVVGMIVRFGIVPFIVGILLWIFGKFVDARQSISAAFAVAVFATVPFLVSMIVAGIQGALLPPDRLTGAMSLTLSPARFYDPATTSPYLLAILSRFDLFVIWATVLLAIGLAVTGRISKGRAAIAAFIVWLCGFVFPVLGASRLVG